MVVIFESIKMEAKLSKMFDMIKTLETSRLDKLCLQNNGCFIKIQANFYYDYHGEDTPENFSYIFTDIENTDIVLQFIHVPKHVRDSFKTNENRPKSAMSVISDAMEINEISPNKKQFSFFRWENLSNYIVEINTTITKNKLISTNAFIEVSIRRSNIFQCCDVKNLHSII